MVEDIAYIPVECAYCGSSESLISPPEPFICLSCENKIELSHQSYLKEITIDKYGKHYRCPECNDVQLSMTDNYVLCFSISFLEDIDVDKLPVNFDYERLPLKYCPECRVEAALSEAEDLLEDV